MVTVNDHAHGVAAAGAANGQTGIVCSGGSGSDNNRIRHCANPVQMGNSIVAVDESGATGNRGNASVQALAQLTNNFGATVIWHGPTKG